MAEPPLKLVWSRDERSGPFDALLEAAERDAEAAEGLASGYAALGLTERWALVEAVIADRQAAERSPAGPLALLLSVEPDPALSRAIAEALLERSGGERGSAADGCIWGSDEDGGVALARRTRGSLHEVVCVTWRGGRLEALRVEPLAPDEALGAASRRLGIPDGAEHLPWDLAVDRLAASLWRARVRHGKLPDTLQPLAHLFVRADLHEDG